MTTMTEIHDSAVKIMDHNTWGAGKNWLEYGLHLPRILCNDGFEFSAQAGSAMYSVPRENLRTGYLAYELGYTNEFEPLLEEYAECEGVLETIYPFVPVEVVDAVLEKHGGFKMFV